MVSENSARKSKIIIYSLPTIIVFAASVLFSYTQHSRLTWSHLPFHSALEAIGALVAILLSIFLLFSKYEFPQDFFGSSHKRVQQM